MDKNQLQNEINQILNKNKINSTLSSKEDREILYIERELKDNKIKIDFEILISELIPEKSDKPFGKGDFKRDNYLLSWKKGQDEIHRLFLTNIQYNNSKLLINCPTEFKRDTFKYLERFVQKLAEDCNKKLN